MTVKLLTEQHFEFLNLTGGCTGSSESIHVKMPHCWKSHVTAQMLNVKMNYSRCLLKVAVNGVICLDSGAAI